MKPSARVGRFLLIGLTVGCVGSGVTWQNGRSLPAWLCAEAQQTPGMPTQQSVDATTPIYKPPLRGAPMGRIGGGTRGGGTLPSLAVLAPDHTGFTVQEQPTLYWYLSQVPPHPVEVTLIEAQGVKPVFEMRLSSPLRAGIQRIRLADHGVHLIPGGVYRWSVALIPNPDSRSQDVVAGGTIELMLPSETLQAQLAKGSKADKARIYAEAGIWYDAMAALGELIDLAPQDRSLRQQRAALLNQVGVSEVATYDLQQQ